MKHIALFPHESQVHLSRPAKRLVQRHGVHPHLAEIVAQEAGFRTDHWRRLDEIAASVLRRMAESAD